MYERSIVGTKNYQNSIFANTGPFYLNSETIDNPKKVNYLKEVVVLCGGTVTENKSAARFVVTDRAIACDHPKQAVVDTTFVFDSAMKGTCMEAERYKPKADQV